VVPVRGWVIDDCGPELLIKLKSGPTVQVPNRDDMRWGDPAYVLYDYESHQVRTVLSHDQFIADEGAEEIVWHELDLPWDIPTPEELIDTCAR
jgi:hypothetical protein